MQVDINNVRLQACMAYKRLCVAMNDCRQERPSGTYVFIGSAEIKDDMDTLRDLLATIACSYIKDNPDFKDLSDNIGELPIFDYSD